MGWRERAFFVHCVAAILVCCEISKAGSGVAGAFPQSTIPSDKFLSGLPSSYRKMALTCESIILFFSYLAKYFRFMEHIHVFFWFNNWNIIVRILLPKIDPRARWEGLS